MVVYYVIAFALYLLWRARQNERLNAGQRLPDGSCLSRIYLATLDRRNQRIGIVVRVIDYRFHKVADSEPLYRLITTIFDPKQAPALESAALHHERWEIENSLDGLKTHLRGARIVLRSKGAATVLGAVDGSFCHPRPDARGRLDGRPRSGHAFIPTCRTSGSTPIVPLRRYSPAAKESPA